MQRKVSLITAGIFLLLSLLLLSFPGDGEKVIPKKPTASIDLLQSKNQNPQLLRQDGRLTRSWSALLFSAQMNGWRGSLNGNISGVRTYAEQKRLHQMFIEGTGPPAFHPDGPSRHILKNINSKGQWSQAVDVSRPEELIRVAKTLGVDLYQPYRDEPWHIEARSPFKLSGFFPGAVVKKEGRAPISALLLLALVIVLLVLFAFVFQFEATRREERVFLILGQTLLLLSLPLLLYNFFTFSNQLALITLGASALAFALLLLLPARDR